MMIRAISGSPVRDQEKVPDSPAFRFVGSGIARQQRDKKAAKPREQAGAWSKKTGGTWPPVLRLVFRQRELCEFFAAEMFLLSQHFMHAPLVHFEHRGDLVLMIAECVEVPANNGFCRFQVGFVRNGRVSVIGAQA
ncbi:hypothetical protein ACFFWD_16705 [Bradyrhizobium erythrophlei]|uniref:hypothetical protein n=1 Tax=Bradyrhizobium erythrophlei TaxID=1437360 RepID=UPI0035ED90AA